MALRLTSNDDRDSCAARRAGRAGLVAAVVLMGMPFAGAGGPGVPYSNCGMLDVGPQGCRIFIADDGSGGFIQNTGNFSIGDRVWVSGIFQAQSALCPPIAGPGIVNNTIGECFQDCGVVDFGPHGCNAMLRTDDGGLYALENVGPFTFGDRVWVRGCLNANSTICFPPFNPAIEDNEIGRCFRDCGLLVQGVECVLFQDDSGDRYVLDELGGFSVGDRVWVTGRLDPDCVTFCGEGNGCIHNNTIGRCFEGCGTLHSGPQGCPTFRALSGNVGFFIENIGTFGIGDQVWVRGHLNPESRICGPFTAPGLEDNSIAACFSGCGTVMPTPIPECTFFVTDCGRQFALLNPSPAPVDARMWVVGEVLPDCVGVCGPDVPCLDNEPLARCFDQCGRLIPGPLQCVLLAADNGNLYAVENQLPFGVGDRVHVIGGFDPACTPDCVPTSGCVRANEIRPACTCDVNCDGRVDFFDIDPFLIALFEPDRYRLLFPNCDIRNADINNDCRVDFFDIDAFLDCLFGR